MSLVTNKLESSLDLHDLEQFIDKKYSESRQRDGINRDDSNNLSVSEKVQPSLNRSTKYGTFENLPFSAFYVDYDTQFAKDICSRNCKKVVGKRAMALEHGLIKYLVDQIE